jgi:hypothetical protein
MLSGAAVAREGLACVRDDRRAVSAERVLWAAVLESALYDVQGGEARLRAAALAWFEARGEAPGGFGWLAEHLGLDAVAVARRAAVARPARRSATPRPRCVRVGVTGSRGTPAGLKTEAPAHRE